jgi:hypothetical protein
MIMEYRTWTSVADMPFSDEATWLPLTRHLEHEHSELGPVFSWEGDGAMVVILASDEPDPATAAEAATRVVSAALHACTLADRFPTVFQVEPAADLLSV